MSAKESAGQRKVSILWQVGIVLRDGIRLSATVYLPSDQTDPAPCILTLTPYIADTYHDYAMYVARQGLPFVVVDVRGRGNSEGQFRPLIQEAEDAFDVIEWLAVQPYCSGKIGMWGGSYAGYVQWAAAKSHSSHLFTIAPAASPYPGLDFPMRSNIFYPHLIRWLAYTSGRTAQVRLFGNDSFWSNLYREWHESGDAFSDLDSRLGGSFPVFKEWLSHPEPDAYWDGYNLSAEQYAKVTFPVLTITGSYDDDQLGALEHYRRHVSQAETGAPDHYLIIGPWDHDGTRAPKALVGGVEVGSAGLLNLAALHVEWYRYAMDGGLKPAFLRNRVAYYVMGSDEWRYADSLASVTSSVKTLFLNSTGAANLSSSKGGLNSTISTTTADTYRYDPNETRGPEVEAEARRSGSSLVDFSTFTALEGRILTYESAPLEESFEVGGFFRLDAWISIDCPDTDLYVAVYEVLLDDKVIRLSTAAIRARYRGGLRQAKLIATMEPLHYDFNSFTFISRRICKGHRLRLVISPIGALIDATFVQKNYNNGGIVAEETQKVARPATITVFHDIHHPSALHVPCSEPVPDGKAGGAFE